MEESLVELGSVVKVVFLCTHSAQLECELRKSDDKIAELCHALTSLDKDHDAVMAEVDEKSETVARLNREMEERERSLSEAQRRVAQLEGEIAHVKGHLEQRVMETTTLRSQLEGGGKEVGELRSHCETLARKENELRDDLFTMTQVLYLLHISCSTCVPHFITFMAFLKFVGMLMYMYIPNSIAMKSLISPRSVRQYVLS